MALLVIGTAVIVPSITFQIRRDREEELVHRGVQYSRAIRAYVKKTGRYPVRLEELQDAGGMKFLRKIYKDPLTGQGFRLLHVSDISGSPSAGAKLNPASPDANENNASASSADGASTDDAGATPQPGLPASPVSSAAGASNPGRRSIGTADKGGPQGLLIFGVASSSKSQSIREFDHKNHYNEWLFFYDPQYDRGAEIKGPTSTASSVLQPPPGQSQPPGTPSQTPAPATPEQPQQ